MQRQNKDRLTNQVIPAAAVLLGGSTVYLANKYHKLSRKNESYKRIVNKLVEHRIADMETMSAYEKEIGELKNESVTDPLTGLNNRRAFDLYLKAIGSGGVRPVGKRTADKAPLNHPYSVLILDVDKFKSVNDTYKHAGGDEVLKGLAGILKTRAQRDVDLPARLGGEEFALILPGANIENAVYIAELIREDAQSSLADPLRSRYPDVSDITVSIGVGELDLSRPLEESIEAIDGALYYAKEHGRNQVVTVSQAESGV